MLDEFATPSPVKPARRAGTGLTGETASSGDSTFQINELQPLEIVGDFELIGKLGQGGMGMVYRARQISQNRQVALKLLPATGESEADCVARFEREARMVSSLSHRNLVKVYTFGVADGCHYIAMELVEGGTAAQRLKDGAMPPLEALRITLDVAHALEHGWREAQLIHRDIKPGNILLSKQGEVKLADFGLAKCVGSHTHGSTQAGATMGTLHYISPEQARGDRELDVRTDIYSLGCTLYHMLTGQTPYPGGRAVALMYHIQSPPPEIFRAMPHCPLPVAELVSKMMKKSRRERYQNYAEFIAAIERVRRQLDPVLAGPSRPAAIE